MKKSLRLSEEGQKRRNHEYKGEGDTLPDALEVQTVMEARSAYHVPNRRIFFQGCGSYGPSYDAPEQRRLTTRDDEFFH